MEQAEAHALIAAYALDALDKDEELEVERHLAGCDACREELPVLLEAASALAYGVESAPVPRDLRGRILAEVRAERARVVPLRARAAWRATAGLAAAAAVVAVLLGAWAMSLRNSLDETRSALASQAHATAILSDPESRQVALRGRAGRLVISPAGEAALVVSGLRPAPGSKIYRIWVEEQGTPHLAARFHAEQGRDVVELTRTVPSGAKVLVTLEPDDDRTAPSVKPFITARA